MVDNIMFCLKVILLFFGCGVNETLGLCQYIHDFNIITKFIPSNKHFIIH